MYFMFLFTNFRFDVQFYEVVVSKTYHLPILKEVYEDVDVPIYVPRFIEVVAKSVDNDDDDNEQQKTASYPPYQNIEQFTRSPSSHETSDRSEEVSLSRLSSPPGSGRISSSQALPFDKRLLPPLNIKAVKAKV